MATKKALLLIADGSEEMEAVITIDVLRRAGNVTSGQQYSSGFACARGHPAAFAIVVTVAGIAGTDPVTCSRQVKIIPDTDISGAVQDGPYDIVVLPGGLQGAKTMAKASTVRDILLDQQKANRIVGAICAAPIALKSHNIATGCTLTSHPSVKDQLEGYTYSEARVVTDGNVITSRGPGTAMEFALAIVESICGKEKCIEVAKPMIVSE